MSDLKYVNNFESHLEADVSVSDMSLVIHPGDGLRLPVSCQYELTVWTGLIP